MDLDGEVANELSNNTRMKRSSLAGRPKTARTPSELIIDVSHNATSMRRSFLSSPTWRAGSGSIPNRIMLAPLRVIICRK